MRIKIIRAFNRGVPLNKENGYESIYLDSLVLTFQIIYEIHVFSSSICIQPTVNTKL